MHRLNFKPLSRKQICFILIGVFLISMIPLLYIGRYNHSCADDYSYGLLAHQTWLETHSIFQTIGAAVERAKIAYMDWQGTYSAIFLMAIHPAVFGEEFYSLVPYIMYALLITSTLYFGKVLLRNCLNADRYSYGIICMVVLILSIQLVEGPSQSFYWYNGSIFYTGYHALMLFLLGLLIQIWRETVRWKIVVRTVGAVLLGAFVGGGNYITALLTTELCVLFLVAAIVKNRKRALPLALPTILLTAGFIVSIIAPGNAVRQALFTERYSALGAVWRSFGEAFKWVGEWASIYMILAVIFLIPILWNIALKTEFQGRYPLFAWILSYCIFASSFTPNFYAQGEGIGDSRTHNIRFFLFIILLVVNLFWTMAWLSAKVKKMDSDTHKKAEMISAKLYQMYSCCFYAVIVVCVGFVMLTQKKIYQVNSVSALSSLVNGEAKIYGEEEEERIKILTESDEKEVVLEMHTVRPKVLFFDDIRPGYERYQNVYVAKWYGKDKVIVE